METNQLLTCHIRKVVVTEADGDEAAGADLNQVDGDVGAALDGRREQEEVEHARKAEGAVRWAVRPPPMIHEELQKVCGAYECPTGVVGEVAGGVDEVAVGVAADGEGVVER